MNRRRKPAGGRGAQRTAGCAMEVMNLRPRIGGRALACSALRGASQIAVLSLLLWTVWVPAEPLRFAPGQAEDAHGWAHVFRMGGNLDEAFCGSLWKVVVEESRMGSDVRNDLGDVSDGVATAEVQVQAIGGDHNLAAFAYGDHRSRRSSNPGDEAGEREEARYLRFASTGPPSMTRDHKTGLPVVGLETLDVDVSTDGTTWFHLAGPRCVEHLVDWLCRRGAVLGRRPRKEISACLYHGEGSGNNGRGFLYLERP